MQRGWFITVLAVLASLAAATSAPAQLSLTVNQTVFHPGETLQLTIGLQNEGPALSGDIYAGIVVPDGSVAFLTSLSPPTGAVVSLDNLAGIPKLFPNLFVAADLDPTTIGVASFALPAGLARGEYTVFAALTGVGALGDGRIDEGDLISLVVRPVTVVNVGTGPTAEIEISPAAPTADDSIFVRLSGVWSDSCVPRDPQVRITGSEVRIDTAGPGAGFACLAVLTPWELPVGFGALPAGTYRIVVIHSSFGQFLELGRRSFEVR